MQSSNSGLNSAIENAVAQAQAIKAREDFNTLPKDVQEWVESILFMYGPKGN